MPISHSHRFIYIHVPKCAGASINAALAAAGTNLELQGTASAAQRASFGQTHLQHVTAAALRASLGAEAWTAYYKFSVVRNPWDWLVSLYHFHHRDRLARPGERPAPAAAARGRLPEFKAWAGLICRVAMHRPRRGALYYLADDRGEVLVDHVAKYEDLAQEFPRICSKLGISAELPHLNSSRHAHYREYYDAGLANLVGLAYKHDIDKFEYSF